ncbi:MAG: TolC family protein [Bacteroidota bacterium]
MTFKMKQSFTLIVLILLVSAAAAQDRLVLDLREARKHALEYNKTLKNSGLATDLAREKLKETIAAGLPQIAGTMDYSNAMGAKISIRFNPDMPASEIPIRPQSNFNLQVNQLLFSGNYFVGIQLARLGADLSQKSYEKTEQEVLAQVTDAYHLVLMSGELLVLLQKNMDNLKEMYEKTAALEKVGIIEMTDVDMLSVQISSLQNAINSSERQLEMARNMLRLLVGVSAGTEMELSESLSQVLTRANARAMGAAGMFNVQQNLDFQLIQFQEKLMEKQIQMQQANYLPTLVSFYTRTEKILKPDFDMSPKNMIGLRLSIPVFSGGTRSSQVRQARIDLETTRNTKALLMEQLEIQEKQLQFNLRNAMETYTNQVKNLDVSRRVYNNLKLKFEHGLISGLDLVNADNNYVKAETDYISAVYQVLSAQNELDKLYGQIK